MASNNNYTSATFWLTLLVVVILIAISLIPSWNIGEAVLKRANIVSDLLEFGDEQWAGRSDSLAIDSADVSKPIDTTQCVPSAIKGHKWSVTPSAGSTALGMATKKNDATADTAIEKIETETTKVDIEDYAETDSPHSIAKFYQKLVKGKGGKPIRIAVIGDSFVEGDMLSADIREQLQGIYSGGGTGFVPTSSPVAQYRGTVKHTFSGWQTHSILKVKKAPQAMKDKFFVSGMIAVPSKEGATVRYEGVGFRKNLKNWTNTRLLFINEQNSEITVTINDVDTHKFTPDSGPNLQHIDIDGEIRSISYSITNPEGFINYGAVLDNNNGINVDNYGLRGNSGLSLISANSTICRQVNEILDYDLVILQFGLNVLSADVSNYNNYAMQMGRVVEHIKTCFPKSAVMIFGISDRSIQKSGSFNTMPTLHKLLDAQRDIALKSGVSFWSIYDAMGGYNSMVNFVSKGWAAKDYTHISYAGGRRIAKEFVGSLIKGKEAFASNNNGGGGGQGLALSGKAK